MQENEATVSPLFMQLLVFTDCSEIKPLLLPLQHLAVDVVLYRDLNDPQGIGLLAFVDNPDLLVADLRDTLDSRVFRVLMQRHELTMTGRGWSGDDLSLEQARSIVRNEELPWAVWFSLRTTPAFARLDESAQAAALDDIATAAGQDKRNHGLICLKSHALDRSGNTFMFGAQARRLDELSLFVEALKGTAQFAKHVAAAGPFFVGRARRDNETGAATGARW